MGEKKVAERRMFAKSIIDSDAFLDMPITARLLYYDLAMRADDDGFVNSPKKIMRIVGAAQDDLKLLAVKKFIIPFENGVVVIKHWRIHNYIRKDMYHETKYKEEKGQLILDENNAYSLPNRSTLQVCNEVVTNPSTQVRLGKDSIENNICSKTHQKEIDDFFESVWDLYIRKEGKSSVSKKAKEEIFNVGFERMKACIERYAKQKEGYEKKYILMGSTFFNGRYKDYLPSEIVNEPKTEVIADETLPEMTDEEWEKYVQSEEWENN